MTDLIYLGIMIAFIGVLLFGDIKLSESLPDTKKKLMKKKETLKKLLVSILLFTSVSVLNAQNIEFLYGYGNNTPVNFITTEVYKPLDNGPIYYFTDFKFNKSGNFEAYTEISKYWIISRDYVSLTAQYNVGISSDKESAIHIDPVYLVGLSKSTKINELTLSLDVLYRIDKYTKEDGVQFTFQYSRFWNRLQVSGYCDLWDSGEYMPGKHIVVLFEPQIFYKITKRVSAGVEGRLSNYTLLAPYDNYIMAGLKWNIEN